MASAGPENRPVTATFSSAPDTDAAAQDIKDETGSLAGRAISSGPIGYQTSQRIRRRIDRYVLPFLCITYALLFMGKTTMSYCSVYGIFSDDRIQDRYYARIITFFYLGYLAAEYPSIAIMQRFRLAKFLGVNIILWGAVFMTTAECSSFGCLATVRFLLGVVEASISPGFIAITGIWWTRQEQASRSPLWVSFLGVGNLIGTLLAYVLARGQAELTGWKNTFLWLGGLNISWGVLFLVSMPDNPTNVVWLDENERVAAVQRIMDNKTGTRSRHFAGMQIFEAVIDIQSIILGLISFANATSSSGLAFIPFLIEGFGFDPLKMTLLILPLYAVQVVAQLSSVFLFARIPNSRLHIASLAMLPPILGAILINYLQPANKIGRLVGVWLLGFYPVGFAAILGLLSTNIAGTTKRSVAIGWVFICYCVGQILGTYTFKNAEAPGYHSGIIAMLYFFVINLLLNQILRLHYVVENKKRDKALAGRSEEEIEGMRKFSRVRGFQDVTDKDNTMFRYAL